MSEGHGSKFWGVFSALAITGMGLIFLVAVLDFSRNVNNPTPAIACLAAGAIFFALLRGPVGRGIAKMLEGQAAPDDQLVIRVEQLEDRLSELGMDQIRVAELEERLDFAERLLSQRESAGMLRKPDER